MLEESYKVRFYETDALKHVSNTTLVQWFESAREPIFKMFTPELDVDNWPLILASYKVDFLKQIFLGEVTIKTGISRLGGSSFDVFQEVWQNGERCAKGVTTMVHFDYQGQKACPVPDAVRAQLQDISVAAD
ncbi:acyl-CoA thioesterase [Planctobacterium marinum]|uniref:acyl-CoA thioesterase n=1 Tax=Planctobacterium marinum TaxID=1631968 RepID=UPI001E63630B|nr:thioesterase family protein [Planctobacterium marinum]MCC2607709.1 acyl-CoA thioesterase [Planctobacterium marinum]